ncbi:hypothetical protein N5079_05610 [Planotetraspora sp. A-T 1434]|uniref:hypothetical protein n=1 Tax=Planotetraspora sp. A-T 1434 TaxID=2979219 RepID=UPI0021C1EB01|nr:hypothetical protein [Planotetraspora sp. A-T 1434]MCT9929696.1 hypothetical protein [Planotetraspora sp. A-T 1434]
MSAPTGTGDIALDPGRGMAWVNEHGAHLVDYASYHLDGARMLAAVSAALGACSVQAPPAHVTDRAWLLAVLRRACGSGGREGYRPGPGPGAPDGGAVWRAWTLVDPLGAETLRLLYRHELPLRDLSYVLSLPVRELGRLVTRTQDVVEILVSGLDGIARGRPICPDLVPLVSDLFPDEPGGRAAGDSGAARVALLSHIVKCVVCNRPINIRYTVPQILSHPPIAALAPEVRRRLLDSLPDVGTVPARVQRPPSSFGMPLSAPVDAGLVAPEETKPKPPPSGVVTPPPASARPAPPPASAPPPTDRARTASPPERPRPVSAPEGPRRARPGEGPVHPADPPAASGRDTPLYDALMSQIYAREALARGVDAAEATQLGDRDVRDGHFGDVGNFGDRSGLHRIGVTVRIAEVFTRAGALIRTTTLRIVIVVVAGAAGTLAGINLLSPAAQTREPARSLESSVTQAAIPGQTAIPGRASVTAQPSVPVQGGGPTPQSQVVGGVQVPTVVTLDDFGRGSITLTAADKPLEWRITAHGLAIKPSSGTLKPGHTDVISVRALRVRYWCGVPAPVTTPLVLRGPRGESTTTVRWRTC